MPSHKLTRTTYRDPLVSTNPVFQRDSTCGENAVDMEEFYTPLFDVHGSGLHDWGIGEGLDVTATTGNQNLTVTPGIGVDVAGKHISLGEDGSAEVGANPETSPPDLRPVSSTGVVVPTAGQAGTKYLVVRWWETFDESAYQLSYGAINRFDHTPWIRLVNTGGFADTGVDLVLAQVTIDGNGNVTSIDEGLRRQAGISTGTIEVRRGDSMSSLTAPDLGVENTTAGKIKPRDGGGLDLTVASVGDRIHVERDDGGTFNTLEVAADRVVARRGDGKETVTLDGSDAWLRLGTNGVEGDLIIKDNRDEEAIALNGQTAAVHIGGPGNEGDLNVRNNSNQKTFIVNGSNGDVSFRGALKDIDGAHPGVTHEQLKDLTDGGTSSLHRHTVGRFGSNGGTKTQIGVITGWVQIDFPYVGGGISGSVVLDFSSRNPTPSGQGFNTRWMTGYQGDFTSFPNAIISPTQLHLSTHTNTYFGVWYTVNSTSIDIGWDIDTSGYGQRIQFMVIGGI